MKPYLQTVVCWNWRPLKIILLGLVGYGITRIYQVNNSISQEFCIWAAAIYMVAVMPNRWFTGLIWAGILSLFYWAQW